MPGWLPPGPSSRADQDGPRMAAWWVEYPELHQILLTTPTDKTVKSHYLTWDTRPRCHLGILQGRSRPLPWPTFWWQECWLSILFAVANLLVYTCDSTEVARLITLRAKHSGAVYCNRSCLWRKDGRTAGRRTGGVCGGWAGGVCYHDNSKLRPSIFTKLGLYRWR